MKSLARVKRLLPLALPSILLVAGFTAPQPLRASPEINEKEGAKLLAAELRVRPDDLDHTSCNALFGALYRAVTTHRGQALSLLDAALSAKGREAKANGGRVPCECASKLLRAALAADPKQASALTEQAVVKCTDCADTLGQVVANFSDKNVAVPGTANNGTRNGMNDSFGNPAIDGGATNGTGNPVNGTGAADPVGPGFVGTAPGGDNAGSFGVGFGPGFPGSPGFVGSGPSGGVAVPLPNPATPPVTSVTND